MTKHGAPDVLQVQERPDPPSPGPGEATVCVQAAGVAFSEVAARVGVYPPAPKPPAVLGTDIAGTVAAIGDGVSTLSVGDRVFGVTQYNGHAELVNTLADNVRPLSETLSFEQGAAIGINYATAWMSLVSYGGIQHQRDSRVLIHAAAGGVGIAALQIARRYQAEIWGTASKGKHQTIRKLGVDHPIDYNIKGWHKDLPTFDVILDPLGGSNWRISYGLLRPGGRTVNYGASNAVPEGRRSLLAFAKALAVMPRPSLLKMLWASKGILGLSMPALWDDRGSYGPFLDPLVHLIDDGTIQPVIDGVFPFDKAPDAHRRLMQRKNIGKVILVP
jgi:NADPH:quinone reductase-like Zn-dependent oxidoreductase